MWMGTWTRWTHFIRTRAGKKAGDFKRFPYRCVCGDHAGSLLYDRYRSNFRNTYPKGSVCACSRIFLARCFSGIAVMTLQPAKKRGFCIPCFQCTESQGKSSLIFSGSALCGTYAARIRMVWSRGNRGGAAQFLLF